MDKFSDTEIFKRMLSRSSPLDRVKDESPDEYQEFVKFVHDLTPFDKALGSKYAWKARKANLKAREEAIKQVALGDDLDSEVSSYNDKMKGEAKEIFSILPDIRAKLTESLDSPAALVQYANSYSTLLKLVSSQELDRLGYALLKKKVRQ